MMNNQKCDVRGSNSSGKLNSSKDFQKYNKRQLNDSGTAYGNGSSNPAPNLHVGGIKMRERKKGQKPLRVVQSNKQNDTKYSDNDEKSCKANVKRKGTRKIIKAGSLVRKSINPYSNGRNAQPSLENDFSNSFIEGKSFVNNNNKKPNMSDKPLNRDIQECSNNETDASNAARNVRDLDRNSKILDFQNKLLSSASIGPYPISNNGDPNSTIKSFNKENDSFDKKSKQKQYVQELEEQIRLRDQIKNEEEQKMIQKRGTIDKFRDDDFNVTPQWSNMNYNKTLKSNNDHDDKPVGYSMNNAGFAKSTNEANLSPSKSTGISQDRKGLGSAPKAVGTVIMRSQEPTDPFVGNIPTRKKVVNRIDQELESRGSIFSGRDERSVLAQKRNLQQQHMREELLRQIEEKKRREEDIKKKLREEELEEEQRIQKELSKITSEDQEDDKLTRRHSEKLAMQNQIDNNAVFPELTTRQKSEPTKAMESSQKAMPEESIYKMNKSPTKMETTAAFAANDQVVNTFGGDAEEDEALAKVNQESIQNVISNESNKIKDMISQVDNKKSLQDQISKRMDMKSNQANSESTVNKGPVVGNAEIGELSDIVKKLLEEQRDLKSKLNERDNIIADLSKEKTTKRKNTQDRERRTRSLKPPANNKKVGSADNKSLAARRLREKYSKDKERISAIEDKIEKARRRKAELNKETRSKAGAKGNSIDRPTLKNRPSSDIDPKMIKYKQKSNQDLDGVSSTNINANLDNLNVCKPRAVESPGYTISSKIDELNTQSRSKRSNYEYANEMKAGVSRKLADKYSNLKVPYDDLGLDDDIQEDQAFMFSLPPDDDDNYSSYSLLGGQLQQRTPMTEFDVQASDRGGDQIDMLMNAYSRSNVRPMDKSEYTTSVGMNYSPNVNDFYVVSRDDNASGFYQSGSFPTPPVVGNSNARQQYDQFYSSGHQPNFGIVGSGYPNNQYHATSSESQYRARQINSNAMAGAQMMSNNGKLIMSPGNRVGSNIMYMGGTENAAKKR